MFRVSVTAVCAAALAFVAAVLFVNHGLVDSRWFRGPGLTPDESFNIEQGVLLVDALAQHGPLLWTPAVAKEFFGSKEYLPDHPPLGRLLLGISHELTSWWIAGSESCAFNVPAARLGSCVAFAVTVLLLCEFARRKYGVQTAVLTALLLIGMPHLTGHARLAALESTTNLTWIAALAPLLAWWCDACPPNSRRSIISGALWGLLLLTKMQAVLLPPVIVLWSLWQFHLRAIRPLICWTLAGLIVFLACWPWLWLDPAGHVLQYLGRATDRATLYCWYFGQRFADKDVPWHFPGVMVMISLPVSIVTGLVLRLKHRGFDRTEQLLLLSLTFPLIVFTVPGVPVYDGTRLFLIAIPSLALFSARGIVLWLDAETSHTATRGARAKWRGPLKRLACMTAVFVPIFQCLQPFCISQYGILAGGNRGAAWMGMEASYWADGLNSDFWEQIPERSTVYVAPVIHQFQLTDMELLVPVVRQRNIRLEPYYYDPDQQRGLLLLIHRLADLPTALQTVPPGGVVLCEVRSGGAVLARLVNTTNASFPVPGP